MTNEEWQLPLEQHEASKADTGANLSQESKSWRDLIKVHPAAELFPRQSEEALDALGEDIAKNGLLQGVLFWTPDPPGSGRPTEVFVLDGISRLDAIDRIPDPQRRADEIARALSWDADHGGTARLLYGHTDPWAIVVSLNLARRQLTREETYEVIAGMLKERPDWSDRKIAKLAVVSDKTVGSVRRRQEARAEIPQLDRRTGGDGKTRPARHSVPQGRSKPKRSESQLRDVAITGFSKVLHQRTLETLDGLTHLLRAEQANIVKISLKNRVAFARAYLGALGVGLDDLSPERAST